MANEITVIAETRDRVRLLFLYPIVAPEQLGGVNVVPTPSADLPPVAQVVVTQPEKDALDAGTGAFDQVSYHKTAGVTSAEHLARARVLYAAKMAEYLAAYTIRYGGRVGNRFNAV